MPANKWDGVRDTSRPRPAAYQVNSENMERVVPLTKELCPRELPGIVPGPPYVFKTYDQNVIGEDCLYLGSFYPERGTSLASEEDNIVVRPDYRMGALGWVHFGLVPEKFPEAINLSLQDQIAALRWVDENVGAFGGDPGNITIGGESAGGTAVSNSWIKKRLNLLLENIWKVITDLESNPGDTHPEKFLAAHNILLRLFPPDTNHAWSPVGAVVDGDTIPQNPVLMLSTMPYPRKDFELMIGFAKDEWQFFRGHSATFLSGDASAVLSIIEQVFGSRDMARTVLMSYQDLYPGRTTAQLLNDIMSMQMFKFSSLEIASNFAKQRLPCYVFQCSVDLPAGGGAIHTGDMPFIFRNFAVPDMERWPAFDKTDLALVARLTPVFEDMYGSFIRHGSIGGQPGRWPTFDDSKQTVLWFGESIGPRQELLTAEEEIFRTAGIPTYATLLARLQTNVRHQLGRL